MKFKLKDLFPLFKETIKQYSEDKISRLAAALAYYTVFSLAPMLIIAIAIAGFVWGEEAARGQLLDEIAGLVGEDAAGMVQTMIQNAGSTGRGIVATVVGIVTLILGATGAFTQLQAALNQVWDVPEEETRGGIVGMLLSRLLSFGMVLSIAFLLLVSMVVSAAVSALSEFVVDLAPGMNFLISALNFGLSLVIITGLFALMFKFVPDARPRWKDVWIGAIVTALLFVIGKQLIGFYLARSSTASVFGAAGSLVLILLWVYYSAQIVLIGAEFTAVYAQRYGSGAEKRATPVDLEEARSGETWGRRLAQEQRASTGALPAGAGGGMQPVGAVQYPVQPTIPAPRSGSPFFFGMVVSAALAVIGLVLNSARRYW